MRPQQNHEARESLVDRTTQPPHQLMNLLLATLLIYWPDTNPPHRSVPDTGSTLAILGASLVTLSLFRRRPQSNQ